MGKEEEMLSNYCYYYYYYYYYYYCYYNYFYYYCYHYYYYCYYHYPSLSTLSSWLFVVVVVIILIIVIKIIIMITKIITKMATTISIFTLISAAFAFYAFQPVCRSVCLSVHRCVYLSVVSVWRAFTPHWAAQTRWVSTFSNF